jgi:hypothetical protein
MAENTNQENQTLQNYSAEQMQQQEKNLETATVRNKLSGAEYQVTGKDAIERLMSDANIEILSSSLNTQTNQEGTQTAPQVTSVGSGDTSEMAGVSYNYEFAADAMEEVNPEKSTQAKRSRKSSQNTSENQSNPTR